MSATAVRSRRRYKARVAPRKGPSRTSRIQWDRVGRIALVLVFFAVIASYINPAINLFQTWQDSKAAEKELIQLEAENKKLEKRAELLKTPAAAMAEARKLGMVGPGEQAFKISGLE